MNQNYLLRPYLVIKNFQTLSFSQVKNNWLKRFNGRITNHVRNAVSILVVYNFFFHLCLITATAQPEPCGTNAVMELAKQADPSLQARLNDWERQLQNYVKNHSRSLEDEIITIPTVVHIVYHTDEENLPDSLVYNQIEVLNEDFRRLNADTTNTPDYFKPVAADMRFEFCLATHDPQGNPTNGITRTYTNMLYFPFNGSWEDITSVHFDNTGGKNIWNRDEYMNIWVINLNDPGGVFAYAYLPGANPDIDGIVCNYLYFGKPGLAAPPYGLGRTITHEVGHWLSLNHTFEFSHGWVGGPCSDDLVEDTPSQLDANFNCYNFPHSTCGNYSDMYMNYMDYTGDICTNMFTHGQTMRTHAAVHIMRPTLLTSTACQPLANNDIKLNFIDEPSANYCFSNIVPIMVTIKNNGTNEINSVKIGYAIDGQISSEVTNWVGSLLPTQTASGILAGIPELTPGLHELKVFTYLPNNAADSYAISDTLNKMITAGKGIPAPYTETFTNPYPQNGWSIYDETSIPWEQIGEIICADGSIGSVMSMYNDLGIEYIEEIGGIDELYSPNIDLTNFSDAQLTFDISYRFITEADELTVLASAYCSPPYDLLYHKAGEELDTRQWLTPQTADDWRTETVDLSQYAGQSVMLVFRNTCAFGQWLMIDNISITGTQFPVNTSDAHISQLPHAQLYPNPANGDFWWAQVNNPFNEQTANISLFNLQGQELYRQTATLQVGQNNLPVFAGNKTPGIYFIKISAGSYTWFLKALR